MKYYLSVDRGPLYKPDEQFRNVNIEKIKSQLGHNNNLKLLCEFTMLFPDVLTLKKYLIEKNILPINLKHFDLKITYKYKENTISLPIPISSDEKYFHVNYLSSILISKKNDFEFLNSFLKSIRFHPGLPEEFYLLRQYANEGYIKDPIESIIRNFINSICYKKGKINFRGLYDIAMILSSMTKKTPIIKPTIETNFIMSEEALFEAEELQERLVRRQKEDPSQLSLF